MTEFQAHQRSTFVLSIDAEKPRSHLRAVIEEAILKELGKKKHALGEVRLHLYKADGVASAALHFAEQIREAASDAVNERIR